MLVNLHALFFAYYDIHNNYCLDEGSCVAVGETR